jgi:hypothetical protein
MLLFGLWIKESRGFNIRCYEELEIAKQNVSDIEGNKERLEPADTDYRAGCFQSVLYYWCQMSVWSFISYAQILSVLQMGRPFEYCGTMLLFRSVC